MAFNVVFYTFTKKSNSTARPAGGTSFSCNLKSESSVVNPRIELNYDGNPSGFNYAYIAHYGRYYYITDWTYTPGIWTATMQTDVLATYKNQIGAADLYVLRSSAEYDGNIIDSMYPPCLPITNQRSVTDIPDWDKNAGGNYVVGIAATNSPQMGSVTYFVTGLAGLRNLITYLYGSGRDQIDADLDTEITNIMVGTMDADTKLALSEAKTMEYQMRYNFDPIKYITSCMYVPFNAPTGNSQRVTIGYMDTGIDLLRLGSPSWYKHVDITLPRHPLAATRGEYLNMAPYTRYTINTSLFGDFDLNTAEIGDATSIRCTVVVDCVSGAGFMQFNVLRNGSLGSLLAMRSAQVGVNIALAQNLVDKTGSAATNVSRWTNILNAGMSGIASAASGNVVGAISSIPNMINAAFSGIDSVAKADTPRMSISGTNAGIAVTMATDITLYSEFYDVPPEDNDHRGRPLMKIRTPASLGGYMLISEGDIPIPGTAGEQAEVKAYLEGGFYYE